MEQISVSHLGALSAAVLKDELAAAGVEHNTEAARQGGHGEPATMTIVLVGLSGVAITALASWLLKTRSSNKVRMTYKRTAADGSVEEFDYEHDIRNEEAPETELVASLAKTFKASVGV